MKNIADNLQLAKTVPMNKVKLPARVERKIDGIRLMYIEGKFYTRKSMEVSLPLLASRLVGAEGYMLDMEVSLKSGKSVDRPKVSGMINSAMKGGKIDEDLLWLNLFDAVPIHDYYAGKCMKQYADRAAIVERIASASHSHIRTIPYRILNTIEALASHYADEVIEGYEGVVVKQESDYYQFKRSTQWARFKETKSADLKCIGFIEGLGKYEGMIGALVLEGVVEGQKIVVKVGSGMTDFDRARGPHYYMGKTIEMKYNSITKNSKTGQASLFLPRYVCVRFDK